HVLPPRVAQVLLQLRPEGAVIPEPVDPAVDLARLVDEPPALAERHDRIHRLRLPRGRVCHRFVLLKGGTIGSGPPPPNRPRPPHPPPDDPAPPGPGRRPRRRRRQRRRPRRARAPGGPVPAHGDPPDAHGEPRRARRG